MSYNGYPNYNRWNVSLWINNDEGLYRMALDHVRRCRTKADAARAIKADLDACGYKKTPDGAPYSLAGIRGAIVGME